MGEPYEYIDPHGPHKLLIDGRDTAVEIGVYDRTIRNKDGMSLSVDPGWRGGVAQAVAGDGYRVVPADHIVIDPAELPDVRESTDYADGARPGRPTLASLDGAEKCSAHLDENPNWLHNHALAAFALERELRRRAEPEPDPEQVQALMRVIGEVDLESVRLHEDIARDMYRRGARVDGGTNG